VKLIDRELLGHTLALAKASGRRRANFNLHPSLQDNPHRFLNVMVRGTYVTPHRHLNPPKAETFVILEGAVAFFIFDDGGAVRETHRLGKLGEQTHALGIDIAPGVWHSLAVLTPHAVCFEVKPGPYKPTTDKEFASWAPSEGTPACEPYLEALLARSAP